MTRQLNSRDYEVQTAERRCLRRNRQFVRPTKANGIPKQSELIIAPPTHLRDELPATTEVPATTQNTTTTQEEDSRDATSVHPPADPVGNCEHYRTRVGRVSKPVDRLDL